MISHIRECSSSSRCRWTWVNLIENTQKQGKTVNQGKKSQLAVCLSKSVGKQLKCNWIGEDLSWKTWGSNPWNFDNCWSWGTTSFFLNFQFHPILEFESLKTFDFKCFLSLRFHDKLPRSSFYSRPKHMKHISENSSYYFFGIPLQPLIECLFLNLAMPVCEPQFTSWRIFIEMSSSFLCHLHCEKANRSRKFEAWRKT